MDRQTDNIKIDGQTDRHGKTVCIRLTKFYVNPLYTGGQFHCFMLDESFVILGCWAYYDAFILFLM